MESAGVKLVVSQNKGTQYRPQYTIVLIIGIPRKVPLILGNPQIGLAGCIAGARLGFNLSSGVSGSRRGREFGIDNAS